MPQPWQNDLLNLLKSNGFEIRPLPESLPKFNFPIYFFPVKRLAFHLIPIHQVENVLFFQELSQAFFEENIKLIHLWEDVWLSKPYIVKSRINALFGTSTRIHARLCEARRITQTEAQLFLESNHLQGSTSAKFKFGLFIKPNYLERYEGVNYLVAVATFSTARKLVRDGKIFRSYELIRFCKFFKLYGCWWFR